VIEIPNQQHRGERREQERNGRKRDIPDPIARQSSDAMAMADTASAPDAIDLVQQ